MGYTFLTDNLLKYLTDNNNLRLVIYNGSDEQDIFHEMTVAIKSRSVKPLYRLYLLNYDETIKEDITDDLLDGGSISITFQSGIRRNLNITLDNSTGKWNPSPVSGYLWKDSKFRMDIGLQLKSGEAWTQMGIFIPNDPSLSFAQDTKTVSLQLSDKFASLDGSLGGKLSSSLTVALDSNIESSLSQLLTQSRINNAPYDVKQLHFPVEYQNETTMYTITKTDETTIGELALEFGNMLSCDVYYDNEGYLTFEKGNYSLSSSDSPVIWDFDDNDLECLDSSVNVSFSKAYNAVTVIGANIEGDLVSYTARNENPKSASNIWSLEPTVLRITDDNIYSDELARQRAEYELFKQGLLTITYSFKCTFMPILDVNKIVMVSNSEYGFENIPFLIQSVNIPISQKDNDVSLTMVNVNEVTLK